MEFLLLPTSHTLPPMYSSDAVTAKFAAEPARFNFLMNLSMGIAYICYLLASYMAIRDRKSPYSIHQHTFFLAHDLAYVFSYRTWFERYADFPVWKNMWYGIVIFNCFEVASIAWAIKHERQFDFGCYFKGPVSVKAAVLCVAAEVVLLHVLLRFIIISTHDDIFFNVFWWTNTGMACGTFLKYAARRERVPGQLTLALLIVPVVFFTFTGPKLGMWAAADPWFDRTEFYAIGWLLELVCFAHIGLVLSDKPIDASQVMHRSDVRSKDL